MESINDLDKTNTNKSVTQITKIKSCYDNDSITSLTKTQIIQSFVFLLDTKEQFKSTLFQSFDSI